jgi:pSer/pThr/pTyr-binding forkhead associated (FHA) protein
MNVAVELVGTSERWELPEGEVRIGRDPSCDISIPEERFAGVSREHAILQVTSGEVWIQDLQTPNGTFVDGRRVERERLRSGNMVSLGQTARLKITMAGAARGAAATVVEGHARPPATVVESQVGAMTSPAATRLERRPQTAIVDSMVTEEEEIMMQGKLDMLRNLVVVTLLVCVGLTVMVVLQQQEIRRNRETLARMQEQAQNAVGQFMPQLDQRLNHFDGRLDLFNRRMDGMDQNMAQAEDRFVKRLDNEMPKIMDRYIVSRASRAPNVQVEGEVR